MKGRDVGSTPTLGTTCGRMQTEKQPATKPLE